MNCRTSIFALALTSASLIFTAHAEEQTPSLGVQVFTMDDPAVLAEVNGTPITQHMLDMYADQRGLGGADTNDQQQQALLQELISRELIYQDGINAGLDKDPEVVEAIANQRINIIASATLNRKTNAANITEEEAKAEYNARIKELNSSEYKARHILVQTEAEAKAVIAELNKGADFAVTAKAKSTDPSNQDGGDLGWFSSDQMVKPFADAVAKLDKGKYTTTPVQTEFGWHVILLEDTRAVQPPGFEEVRDQLLNSMRGSRIQAYIEELRGKAKIDLKQ